MIHSCLIIDDDPLICDLLEHFCSKSGLIDNAISVQNCQDGLRLLATEDYDLILLDFNLPDMTGRDFMSLNQKSIPTIMVTSDTDFAAESYSFDDVVDYLVKPLSYDRFVKAVSRLANDHSIAEGTQGENIFIKEGHNLVRIHLPKVYYLKSESNYVSFVTEDRSIMTLASLSHLEKQLPEQFIKAHRSYVINSDLIDEVRPNELIIGGHSVPMSPSFKSRILDRLKYL